MRKRIFLTCFLFLITACAYLGYVKDPFVDIPNFYKVDHRLWRGGYPSEAGLQELQEQGVGTIINLCGETDELIKEKIFAKSHDIKFYQLPMSVYQRPEDSQVLKFLEIVLTPENQPVFVHCRSGRDRTGAMVAVYRVIAYHWGPKEAYKEAKRLGFWPYHGEGELKNFIHQLKDKTIYFEKGKELIDEEQN